MFLAATFVGWMEADSVCRKMTILNAKSDDISRSHSVFSIIQTSRNSYSMCICLLLHGKGRMATNDKWELYEMNSKSEFGINNSVYPLDFWLA